MRRLIVVGIGVMLSAGCGMPMSGGQCSDYTPLMFGCSDGFIEVCDHSSGCEQCSCVPIGDAQPGGANQDARR